MKNVLKLIVTTLVVQACNQSAKPAKSEVAFSDEIAAELNVGVADICASNQVSIQLNNAEETGVTEWHQKIDKSSMTRLTDRRRNNNASFVQAQWKGFYEFVRNHLYTNDPQAAECRKNAKVLAVFDGPGEKDSIVATIIDGVLTVTPQELSKSFFEPLSAGLYEERLKQLQLAKAIFSELDMTADLPAVIGEFKAKVKIDELAKASGGINYFVVFNGHGGTVDLSKTTAESIDALSMATVKQPVLFFDANAPGAPARRGKLSAPVWRRASIAKMCATEKFASDDAKHICNLIKAPFYDFAPLSGLYSMGPQSLISAFATLASGGSLSHQILGAFARGINPRGILNKSDPELNYSGLNGGDGEDGSRGSSVDGSNGSGDGTGTSGSGDGTGTSGSGDGTGTSGSGDGTGTSGSGDGTGTSGSGDGTGTSGAGDDSGTSGKELINYMINLADAKFNIDVDKPNRNKPEGAVYAAPSMSYDSAGLKFELPNPSARSLVVINSCYQSPDLSKKLFVREKYAGGTLWTDAPIYTWLMDFNQLTDYRIRVLGFLLNSPESAEQNPQFHDSRKRVMDRITNGFGLKGLLKIATESAAVNAGPKDPLMQRVMTAMQKYFSLSGASSGMKFHKDAP